MLTRRGVLRVAVAAPLALLARSADARDYKDAAEVWDTLETLAARADARLLALARAYPPASRFVASARADLARHRVERIRLRAVSAAPPAAPAEVDEPRSLPKLREVLADLMHAHAEGLPALRREDAVRRLGEHMVDLSRLVTVVDLWIAAEGGGD
jgi:hypothetical protein